MLQYICLHMGSPRQKRILTNLTQLSGEIFQTVFYIFRCIIFLSDLKAKIKVQKSLVI